jgi:hypothetical protein
LCCLWKARLPQRRQSVWDFVCRLLFGGVSYSEECVWIMEYAPEGRCTFAIRTSVSEGGYMLCLHRKRTFCLKSKESAQRIITTEHIQVIRGQSTPSTLSESTQHPPTLQYSPWMTCLWVYSPSCRCRCLEAVQFTFSVCRVALVGPLSDIPGQHPGGVSIVGSL